MPLTVPPPSVTVVIDPGDDVIHTHTALAAHHPPSGRITLHPGPGTTSETGLTHDLRTVDYSVTADFQAARRHYYGSSVASPSPSDESARPADRWLTLPALDRLVSYDSPRPCADPCTPPPIIWRHRPPPVPLTAHTAQRVAHRLHAATAHPRLAAAIAAALFTGASLQQLATARPRDYDDTVATLALHDRARYTDGCAAYPVPPWAGTFLRAAACFTRLLSGEDQELLAAPRDRGHLLRMAETARLRPPQPPTARRKGPAGRVEWDWRERQEAERYEAMPAR
ncbi:hypothetical protein [Streptomyces netropsis]|uniref:Uncharacterized protein n=1 Tax=Streptomyces netropsis TaxID=55404 RepID=A0A7W7PJL7_STRNE|nr:hypothetical protein [Streptomyces netropsis]MBB4890900.1 hypothetical protein [Streptomyces netropsis]GGR53144.1 hypothetical protein GCM10010219_67680 [Streptomyces netropsis]